MCRLLGRKLIFVKIICSPVWLRSERITQKHVAGFTPDFSEERHNYAETTGCDSKKSV